MTTLTPRNTNDTRPADELAADKKTVLRVDGDANLLIENGNGTLACPETVTAHAAKPESVCIECMFEAARSGDAFSELQ